MIRDRQHAGLELAKELEKWLRSHGICGGEVVVFGIPRGGVIVASVIAKMLNCPLGLMIARKIGAPVNPELAIGAGGPDGSVIVDNNLVSWAGLSAEELSSLTDQVLKEIRRRAEVYGQKSGLPNLAGKVAILVDDGVATGVTARVGIRSLRAAGASSVVLAVPVAPREVLDVLRREADSTICLATPADFLSVGQWYADFHQVTDEEVINALRASKTISSERSSERHGRGDYSGKESGRCGGRAEAGKDSPGAGGV